jgi:hypothetical protein
VAILKIAVFIGDRLSLCACHHSTRTMPSVATAARLKLCGIGHIAEHQSVGQLSSRGLTDEREPDAKSNDAAAIRCRAPARLGRSAGMLLRQQAPLLALIHRVA